MVGADRWGVSAHNLLLDVVLRVEWVTNIARGVRHVLHTEGIDDEQGTEIGATGPAG